MSDRLITSGVSRFVALRRAVIDAIELRWEIGR